MRGRKPKPAAVKLAEGNRGKRRIAKEPKAKSDTLTCPAHLLPSAKTEWRRIVAAVPKGLLGSLDRGLLAAYCQHYGRWVLAEKALEDSGQEMVIVTAKGNVLQNPLIGIASAAAEKMQKAASELGFTPVARTRLAVPDGDAEDEGSIQAFLRIAG